MQNKKPMNIHYAFYIVIISATLKLFVCFLPTTNDRLLLTEVLMGGNFQRHVHKCLWKTDVKCPLSRNHDEMLAEREEIDPGDPSQERSGFSKAASIPKQFAKDE